MDKKSVRLFKFLSRLSAGVDAVHRCNNLKSLWLAPLLKEADYNLEQLFKCINGEQTLQFSRLTPPSFPTLPVEMADIECNDIKQYIKDIINFLAAESLHDESKIRAYAQWSNCLEEYEQVEDFNKYFEQIYKFAPMQKNEEDETGDINNTFNLSLGYLLFSGESVTNSSPLIHFPLEATYDLATETITLKRSEGDAIIENDIPADYWAQSNREQGIEIMLNSGELNYESIGAILRSWCMSLNVRCSYQQSLSENFTNNTPDAMVVFSPSLTINEWKFQNSTTAFLHKISSNLLFENEPSLLNYLTGTPLPEIRHEENRASSLYYPLAANKRQQQVALRIDQQPSLIVEGAPGTGKSQLIANLAVHSIATGKRVLITSTNESTLEHINLLLPESLQQLFIPLINNASSSLDFDSQLQVLIKYCQEPQDIVDESKIEELNERVRQLQNEINASISSVESRFVELNEHFETGISDYSGTAIELIQQWREGSSEGIHWLEDNCSGEPPISNAEAVELLLLIREFTLDDYAQWQRIPVGEQNLLTADEFKYLSDQWQLNDTSLQNIQDQNILTNRSILSDIDFNIFDIEKVNAVTEQLMSRIDTIEQWDNRLFKDVFSGDGRKWQEISAGMLLLAETLNRALIRKVHQYKVTGIAVEKLKDRNALIELKTATEILHGHAAEGKLLEGLIYSFRYKYEITLLENIRLDGRKYETTKDLRQLLEWLEYKIDDIKLKQITFSSMAWDREHLVCKELNDITQLCIDLKEFMTQCYAFMEIYSIVKNAFLVSTLEDAVLLLQAVQAEWHIREVETKFSNNKTRISLLSSVAIEGDWLLRLLHSSQPHQAEEYETNLFQLQRLIDNRTPIYRLHSLNAIVQPRLPLFWKNLSDSCSEPYWDDRMEKFVQTCYWHELSLWLNTKLNTDFMQLWQTVDEKERLLNESLAQLAVQMAWKKTLASIDSKMLGHLKAWSTTIGKYHNCADIHAKRHLKDALEHMKAVMEGQSVSGWIVPFKAIAKYLPAKAQIFDLIIIDDASQLSHEAIMLYYLAKKVVVVGDDEQQIVPLNTTVDRTLLVKLHERYIADIHLNELVDVDNSFYDFISAVFPNPLKLREHYRSLPAIINFSSLIAYKKEPLIPLRAAVSHEITTEILTHHYVVDATVKKANNQISNQAEAESLLGYLEKICKNPKYNAKTIGIISLQGTKQANLIRDGINALNLNSSEIEQRKLKCGSSNSFQGDERDIILLSMVIAPGYSYRALTEPKYLRSYSVAMSRAKNEVHLFHSVQLNELQHECIRYQLLDYFVSYPAVTESITEETSSDEMQMVTNLLNQLENKLSDSRFTVLPGYFISSLEIAFIISKDEQEWHVLADYTHSGKANMGHHNWDLQNSLRAMEIKIIPVSVLAMLANIDNVINEINNITNSIT